MLRPVSTPGYGGLSPDWENQESRRESHLGLQRGSTCEDAFVTCKPSQGSSGIHRAN